MGHAFTKSFKINIHNAAAKNFDEGVVIARLVYIFDTISNKNNIN